MPAPVSDLSTAIRLRDAVSRRAAPALPPVSQPYPLLWPVVGMASFCGLFWLGVFLIIF